MTRKVFVDANVIFAGAASSTGASYAVLALAEIGMIKMIVSHQVIDETERNLLRKFPAGLPILTEWLVSIDPLVLVDPQPEQFLRWTTIIEAKDAPILEAAVQAEVDHFLTLNTKHFTPEVANVSSLLIQTPAQFIEHIRAIISESS